MHGLHYSVLLAMIAGLAISAPTNQLPEVNIKTPPAIPPPPPPPPPSNPFLTLPPGPDGGPPRLADIPGELQRLQAAYKWCRKYNYIKEDAPEEVLENEEELAELLFEPLKRVEEFFELPIDGILDNDLLDEMSSARCGESDEDKMAQERRKKRWDQLGSIIWEDLPLSIKFRDYGRHLSNSDQIEALQHCARLWAKNSGLTFKMADRHEPANIEVTYNYIDGPWNTIGTGQSPVPYRNPPTSILTLDSGDVFKKSKRDPQQAVSLVWAICHEMGHTLGLSHSHDRNAIMYPSGNGQDENDLGQDDKAGIQALYGRPNGRDFVDGGASSFSEASEEEEEEDSYDYYDRGNDRRLRRPSSRRPAPRPAPRPQPQPYDPPQKQRSSPPSTRYSRTRGQNYAPPGHRPNYNPRYVSVNVLPQIRLG